MISSLPVVTPVDLPGVGLRYLETGPSAENVLVTIAPNGTIPLHTHKVDARMYIVAGRAKVLSTDEYNGREVGPGECVLFRKYLPHGFEACSEGLTFLSCNDGIRQADGSLDLQFV
jgi:quercetin dioxygenase-like cupin family protein